MVQRNPVERFWAKVEKTKTCWVWIGARNEHRYGMVSVKGRLTRAHRRSYELFVGPIPTGLHVLHRCDNPPCVRPEHLFLGTQADNMADKMKKGRHRWGVSRGQAQGAYTKPERRRRGETHGNAKLTWALVDELRRRYAEGGISQAALAREYGLGTAHLNAILLNKAWRRG